MKRLPILMPRKIVIALVSALAAAALLIWAGDRWSVSRAEASADAVSAQAARSHAALLGSELQKFRLLPLVLVEYPDVGAAMQGDRAAQDRLNRTLELLAGRTDAADIYVIDPSGVTVAASNWRKPASFVGQNYGFRPYFRDAMRAGSAELFALGTVSRRPGLYLARSAERQGRRLGVVVVKVEFDAVEAAWSRTSGATFVTDRNGVILVTSLPAWRFQTIATVDPAVLATARQTLQFGGNPPRPAPMTLAGQTARAALAGSEASYRVTSEPAPLAGGKLYHLAPLAPPLATARTQALLLGLGALFVVGIAAGLAVRATDTRRLQREARAALEAEVTRRTGELRDANARLTFESQERLEADRRYRAAREELAQANRLGTLGQITAGVAHEINQPVAAIRTFAESGATLIDRGAPERARDNLTRIVALAERIGLITAELRGFARKRTPAAGEVALGSALDGAVMLLGERARSAMSFSVDEGARAVLVRGERVRIEQILVNLLQNALDAIGTSHDGGVSLAATLDKEMVDIIIEDDGGGVDASILDSLFTPFTSMKPSGLGLGLAIARDIAREFGGDIRHDAVAGGARFTLTLRIA